MRLTLIQSPVWGNLRTPWEIAYVKSFVEADGKHSVSTVDMALEALPLLEEFAAEIRHRVDDTFTMETYLSSLAFITSVSEFYLIRLFYEPDALEYKNALRALLSTKTTYRGDLLEKLTDSFIETSFTKRFDLMLESGCKRILDYGSDYIGCTTHITSFPIALYFLKLSKMISPNIRTVLSGYQATMCADEVYATCPWVDLIIRGESESGYLEILDTSVKTRRIFDVINRPLDMNKMPPPDYRDLDMKKYKMISIMASRNCPHGMCNFCQEDAFWSVFRYKEPKLLVDEMETQFLRHGVTRFDFPDLDIRDFVLRLCDILRERQLEFRWSGAMRADRKTPPLLHTMGKANCESMFFGFESASPRLLKLMKKNITLDSLRDTIKIATALGIKTKLTCITGLPTETNEEFEMTLKYVEANRDYIGLVLVQSFKALTRSPIGYAIQQPENEYGLVRQDIPELARVQNLLYSYHYNGSPEPLETLARHIIARKFFRDLGVDEKATLLSTNARHKKHLLGIR
jgi:hypothetical protein